MTDIIRIFVPGIPGPGGSKKAFRHAKTGRIIVQDMGGEKTKTWRERVSLFAEREMADKEMLEGPIWISVVFLMPRPKYHFGSGRNSQRLKDSAPRYPVGKPDATKLMRSTEDAMTGIVWRDDATIVTQEVSKRYQNENGVGAVITIRREI